MRLTYFLKIVIIIQFFSLNLSIISIFYRRKRQYIESAAQITPYRHKQTAISARHKQINISAQTAISARRKQINIPAQTAISVRHKQINIPAQTVISARHKQINISAQTEIIFRIGVNSDKIFADLCHVAVFYQ